METFRGKVHLPGTDGEWNIELEIDWGEKEVNVHIDEAPNGIADWPGLAVQTFGPVDEIIFSGLKAYHDCSLTGGISFAVVVVTSGASSWDYLMLKACGEPVHCHSLESQRVASSWAKVTTDS